MVEATHTLKAEAIAMKDGLLKSDLEGLAQTIQAGWNTKKRLARRISNTRGEET